MNDTIPKVYYKMGEVETMLKVPAHTIRFWVKEFGLKVKTGHGRQRFFTDRNLEDLHLIAYLLYEVGLTVNGAVREFKAKATKDFSPLLTTETGQG